jgi:hypothetical protein
MEVDRYSVGPEFLALYGIPVLRGRTFVQSDRYGTVIVGERFAAALWPELDPVGRSFTFGRERFHVVGVAREIHHPSMVAARDRPEFWEPFEGVGRFTMMSIRCSAGCPDPAVVHHRIAASQTGARVFDVREMDEVYFEQLARPRAAAALGFAFAGIATLAAAGGLFSVLSYAVARRRREFGIRTALGASPVEIRRVVVRDGARVAAVGAGVGLFGALALTRTLASLQYGVETTDLSTWVIVFGILGLTAFASVWRPSREAMRVDPALLLREE